MSVSSQVIEVLDSVFEKMGIAVDWSQQNVLPYLQELAGKYIKYEIATSIALAVFFSLTIIMLIKVMVHIFKSYNNKPYYDEDGFEWLFIFSLSIIILFLTISVIFQVIDIITCYTFPEKMILQFLMENLSKVK